MVAHPEVAAQLVANDAAVSLPANRARNCHFRNISVVTNLKLLVRVNYVSQCRTFNWQIDVVDN
jgi:hypothetical protein